MRRFTMMAAAAVFAAAPLFAAATPAAAQVDLDVRLGNGHRHHGEVIRVAPRHRHACRTVTTTEYRHGHRIKVTERRCR